MSPHNRTLTPRVDVSVMKTALLLLVAILLFAAQAGATNLIQNGSFQTNDFTHWTIGTTSNGTWGSGYPVVTGWPLGGMNAAKGEVGEVNFDGTLQGGTLSQTFTRGEGSVGPNDVSHRTLTATAPRAASSHTFEIDILRPFITVAGNTPYQYV